MISSNFVSFARPKHLELLKPDVRIDISGGNKKYTVNLSVDVPALWTWLELEGTEARYSDNFFHLRPGSSVRVEITTEKPVTPEEFKKRLKVKSLYDTYR